MVSISDIYTRFRQNATLTDYDNRELNEKKELQDRFLQNYLSSKITECLLRPWEVETGSVEELVEKLASILPESSRTYVISQLVYYLLGIISEFQSYDIEWVKDETFNGFVANQNRHKLLLFVTKSGGDIMTSFHDLYRFFKNYQPVADLNTANILVK